ncbi:MAG: hypothetical protein M0R34_07005 [Candidatus Marinimicrobia bacterium]|jgi:hypothetical protein|nr:hypothetical protein [Candidatus Neomarinimicrobiota bacterium]
MRNIVFKSLIFVIFLFGCTPIQYDTTNNFQQVDITNNSQQVIRHEYELLFVDVNGNPIEGVKVDYTKKEYSIAYISGNIIEGDRHILETNSFITSNNGLFKVNIEILPNPKYSSISIANSELDYKASKEGYYSQVGSREQRSNLRKPVLVGSNRIVLLRPIDYLSEEFVSDINLKEKVLSFIDLIVLRVLVTESVLETRSINLVSFKDNSFLQFKFTNTNVYNSLKLNKYDIGKILFDDVIRKVLTPLNDYIGNSNLFYGYDLIVVGHTKSFSEKYAASESIEYRFMIPESIVMQYKNKDISGQQVLDASVILMDDERIELKLQ